MCTYTYIYVQADKIKALENGLFQHRYHIGRLEQIMRLMDNGDLEPEQVHQLACVTVDL